MPASVIAPVRTSFRALASTIVPDAAALGEREWLEVEAIIEEYLSRRPAKLRSQLRTLIRLLGLLPLARHGRRFGALAPEARTRFLERVQDSPVLLIRRGFWGLRSMVYLGYYSRGAAAAEIGYRGDPRGWEARR